jgi:hypothetical protein
MVAGRSTVSLVYSLKSATSLVRKNPGNPDIDPLGVGFRTILTYLSNSYPAMTAVRQHPVTERERSEW